MNQKLAHKARTSLEQWLSMAGQPVQVQMDLFCNQVLERAQQVAINIVIESFSDERLKTDIQGEVLELDFIDSLQPVSFYNKDNRMIRYHRLVSKGIEKVFNVKNDFLAFTHDGGTKGTDHNSMVGPLIKAAQQLSGKIRRPEGEKKTRN